MILGDKKCNNIVDMYHAIDVELRVFVKHL